MGEPTITFCIATLGRPTLARTLESLRCQQLLQGDEVALLVDRREKFGLVSELLDQFGFPWERCHQVPRENGGYWGHGSRNWFMDEDWPGADWLWHFDDDDAFRVGAVARVRAELRRLSGPAMVRAEVHHEVGGGVIWRGKKLEAGNVGTCLLLAPNDPDQLGRFAYSYNGDYEYIRQTCGTSEIAWLDIVAADVYPARDHSLGGPVVAITD